MAKQKKERVYVKVDSTFDSTGYASVVSAHRISDEGSLEVGKGVRVIDPGTVSGSRVVRHLGLLTIAFFILPYAESAGGLQQSRDILDIYHAGSSLMLSVELGCRDALACWDASSYRGSPSQLPGSCSLDNPNCAETAHSISLCFSREKTRHKVLLSADLPIVVICSASRRESCIASGRSIQQSS